MYFDFGIVVCPDGTEIIDRKQRTFYHQLTPTQMVEYIEMDVQLELMDRLKQKAREEAGHKRRFASNLLWKFACFCGFCG
jgi:macrodomain Ter protein organizer (MatP/YcbG family)